MANVEKNSENEILVIALRINGYYLMNQYEVNYVQRGVNPRSCMTTTRYIIDI